MGYSTDYKLQVVTTLTNVGDQEIADRLSEITQYSWYSDLVLECVKWYNYPEQMYRLSIEYPTLLFQLDGEGEESGDIWRSYYLNGKVHKAKVEIVYEDFDIGKLQNA